MYKNILRYTIGLPILLMATVSIVIWSIVVLVLEPLLALLFFFIEGDFDISNDLFTWWIEDIKNLWRPINETK